MTETQSNKMAPKGKLTATPRYMLIAQSLMQSIEAGEYPVGTNLPTELDLVDRFGASRFTIREALKHLSDKGLIRRRAKTGTQVIARAAKAPYVQSVDTLEDMLQYRPNTTLNFIHFDQVVITPDIAAHVPCPVGEKWSLAVGVRHEAEGEVPVAMSRVYLSPTLKGILPRIKSMTTTVHELVEEMYDVELVRIRQVIFAVSLNAEEARLLKVKSGTPALRTVRCYHDREDRLLEVSDSIHPGDRYQYSIEYERSAQR